MEDQQNADSSVPNKSNTKKYMCVKNLFNVFFYLSIPGRQMETVSTHTDTHTYTRNIEERHP